MIVLLCCYDSARGAEPLIEHHGDHYVINVRAMEPDDEMTLMDVLQLCPELTFSNSTALDQNYILCVDDIDLFVHNETFLSMVKAHEVETIEVYTNPSVSQAAGGSEGVININYRKADKDDTTGKLALEGSTYGNGKLYADVKTQHRQFGLRGYALTDLYYAKGTVAELGNFTQRQMVENAHVSADWDISPSDNLMLKMFQQYYNGNEKHRYAEGSHEIPLSGRLGNLVIKYLRTLNDKEATLRTETGSTFTNEKEASLSTNIAAPYFFTELNTPLLNDDLWMMVGWEIDYENIWMRDVSRQQYLKNDFYLQLEYDRGPWDITLGCRHTLLDYWHHSHLEEHASEPWSHHRNATTFLATMGYKWGNHHFVQGSLCRDFYIPTFDDFYEDAMGQTGLNIGYLTNILWRSELRYTYQQRNMAFFARLLHSWKNDMPTPNEQLTGIKTSITWHKGPLRLTAGANFYHQHMDGDDMLGAINDNYYTLKLSPTLLLGSGLRLSSSLLYSSRQEFYNTSDHLFASVKLNKSLGRHCNIYADFHDLTDMPTLSIVEVTGRFRNRALTVGMTYRF